jgi:hypothetical protein
VRFHQKAARAVRRNVSRFDRQGRNDGRFIQLFPQTFRQIGDGLEGGQTASVQTFENLSGTVFRLADAGNEFGESRLIQSCQVNFYPSFYFNPISLMRKTR